MMVLRIFEELPDHRGCKDSVLDDAERQFGVQFPPTYRRLMRLDARRLVGTGVFLSPTALADHKTAAQELLLENNRSFRLEPLHVVFAWVEVFAFYFFEAVGSDDVPVYEFNYYSSDNNYLPREYSPNVADFFAEHIRNYLNI